METPVHYRWILAERDVLRPSEDVVRADVEQLAAQIARHQRWTTALPVDGASGVIMDGNHRWHAARLLELTHLPCVMLDYQDARVQVLRWDDGTAFPLDALHAAIAGRQILPCKTTRHLFAPQLPLVDLPLAQLRRPSHTGLRADAP